MTSREIQQRLQQIEGYSNTLGQAVRVMDERRHILEPLLEDEIVKDALKEKFKGTLGSRAYHHLVPLLAQDLVRDLVRLYLDDDRRSGSLINLYRKASEPRLNKALRDEFIKIPDKWYDNAEVVGELSIQASRAMLEEMKEKHREEFKESFDKTWAAVSAVVEELEVDPVAIKLKNFRDKYHAHLEMSPLGQDPAPFDVGSLGLTYNEIFEFADRYMEPIFELIRISTGTIHDPTDFTKAHRKYGSNMWRILAGIEENIKE